MVLAGNETELDRTLRELVARQQNIDDRVERLETLEGMKRDDGRGCLFWSDYFDGVNAIANVQFNPNTAENGNYLGAQATIFWVLWSTSENAFNTLHMRINAFAGATYYYHYKYGKAAALTHVSGDAQTSFIVGRIPGTGEGQASGVIHIPFWSEAGDQEILANWTLFEGSAVANFQEKGEMGGYVDLSAGTISWSFDFFASAGNLSGRIYLYGWCPEIEVGGGPGD